MQVSIIEFKSSFDKRNTPFEDLLRAAFVSGRSSVVAGARASPMGKLFKIAELEVR